MLLPYLIALTAIFVITQLIVLFYAGNGFVMLQCVIHNIHMIPASVWRACLFYLFAQILLYSIFILSIWIVTRLVAAFFKLTNQQTFRLGVSVWLLSVVSVILANQIFFPASYFSAFTLIWLPQPIAMVIEIVFLFVLSVCFVIALLQLFRTIKTNKAAMLVVSSIFFVGAIWILFGFYKPVSKQVAAHQQPNVIIIGLDDVRPDFIDLYGGKNHNTPNIDHFLSDAVNFRSSMTPLSRTFPAWVSILTGQFPKHNGVRFNLVEQNNLKLNNTLSAILKRHGYVTLYATDDRRFSNISHRFGFDQLIGIKAGANDFLLGTLNDFPLSNLVVNTRLGKFLFPFSYANREAFATYETSSFVNLTNHTLQQIHSRPIFLSIHFCLPHWPFFWAKLKPYDGMTNKKLYIQALHGVDQQFASFLQVLKQNHLLDDAIVIVLSDHGEAFEEKGDRIINHKHYIRGKNSHKDIYKIMDAVMVKHHPFSASASHGTDVLSWSQVHNLLAIRFYGNNATHEKDIQGMVSLIDIKPTILSYLHLQSPDTDGDSLLPYIKGIVPHHRLFFTENGYTPLAVKGTKISVPNAVYEGMDMFQVNSKNGKITLKPSMAKKLMKTKQRALYEGNWVLAFYPDVHNNLVPILANRQTGQWTDDFSTTFAKHSPVQSMLARFKEFYGSEV